jgi:CRISPR type IV-associated protein Csf3
MEIINLPELDAMGDRFAALPMTPFRLTLRTLKPVAGNDALHLDGLLAKAVVIEAMRGKPLTPTEDAYYMPLPLGLDRLHLGLPVWQCNDFEPVAAAVGHTHYHQRSDANPYDPAATVATLPQKKRRRMPPTTEGQYMSYRVPLQYTEADRWQCEAVGNADEALRLLNEYIPTVGKKGAQGYGRVASWEVEALPSFTLSRPVPIADTSQPFNAQIMGWTPPYWHRGLWRLCGN